jgi:hypothetical protein
MMETWNVGIMSDKRENNFFLNLRQIAEKVNAYPATVCKCLNTLLESAKYLIKFPLF